MSVSPSEEQLNVINTIKSGFNVTVDAVAGSGKTTTVLSLADRIPDKEIIQVTYNSELKTEVQQKKIKYGENMNLSKLSIFTYHSFAFQYYDEEAKTDIGISKIIEENVKPKKTLPKADIFVCDEIQDMNELYYSFICKVLRDIGRSVQIILLGDKYQGLYEFKGADTRFLTLGHLLWKRSSSFEFKKMKLTTSYRLTNQITDFVNYVLLGEKRIKSVREGPKVSYIRHTDPYQNYKIIGRKLINMIESGYAKPDDIFVLAASVKSERSPIKMIENMLVRHGVPCYVPMNETTSIHNENIKNKVIFSSFHQSKGRERKVVVVYGFDQDYFRYFNRDSPTDVCPPTLYVAATKATELLILIETAEPLSFLKYTHHEMACSDFIQFEGVPLGEMNAYVSLNQTISDSEILRKTSPTDLIKFLDESLLLKISKIMEDELFTTDYLSFPLNQIKIQSSVKTKYLNYELHEEVYDINGTAIPALYEERKYAGEEKTNSIKEFVKSNMNGSLLPIYKNKLQDIDFNNTTISQHLLLTNIYISLREKLHFKIAQINNYNWLTEPQVNSIFMNMDRHIKNPSGLKHEVPIITHHDDKKHENIDDFIERRLGNQMGKFRFKAIIDALDDNTLWEFKCVDDLDSEHRLQLLIYAWLSYKTHNNLKQFKLMNIQNAEVQTLKIEKIELIEDIISMILKSKFERKTRKSDEEFMKNFCIEI